MQRGLGGWTSKKEFREACLLPVVNVELQHGFLRGGSSAYPDVSHCLSLSKERTILVQGDTEFVLATRGMLRIALKGSQEHLHSMYTLGMVVEPDEDGRVSGNFALKIKLPIDDITVALSFDSTETHDLCRDALAESAVLGATPLMRAGYNGDDPTELLTCGHDLHRYIVTGNPDNAGGSRWTAQDWYKLHRPDNPGLLAMDTRPGLLPQVR